MTSWTETEIVELKTLWRAGMAASRIASKLGGGKSRSAVLGKLWRLGESTVKPVDRDDDVKQRSAIEKPTRTLPSMPLIGAMAGPVLEPQRPTRNIPVSKLKDTMCKWPIGDPREMSFTFCGTAMQVKNTRLPYCEYHASLAVAEKKPKRATS